MSPLCGDIAQDQRMKTKQKVKKAIRLWVLFHVSLLMIIPASAIDSTVRLDVSAKSYPELQIQGHKVSHYPNGRPTAFRGFADPCIRKDPEADQLWLAYSWPHMQHMGGGKRDYTVGVETHLASSHDGGKTWQYEKALWPRTPARYAHANTKTERDGYVCHEVPNIVPCMIDGKAMWVGVRLDYFLGRKGNYKDRENLSFCLKLFAAPTVAGLSEANPYTFGHDRSSPECKVDLNVCNLSDDFPSVFIPNEPALHVRNGRLYLANHCEHQYVSGDLFNRHAAREPQTEQFNFKLVNALNLLVGIRNDVVSSENLSQRVGGFMP
jgi:hypothetical protein